MDKIKHFIEQSWLLIVSAFVFGLLIAVTNAAWKPRIEQNEKDKLNRLMTALITDAGSFEVAIDDANIPAAKGKVLQTDIYKALDTEGETVGFAFIAVGAGFADKIKLVIAVDGTFGKFLGFKVLASNETPGFGSKIKESFYSKQFIHAPASVLELSKSGPAEIIDAEIIAITGATVSSNAVIKIFNAYNDKIKEHLKTRGLITNGK